MAIPIVNNAFFVMFNKNGFITVIKKQMDRSYI